MSRAFCILAVSFLLSGCASAPPVAQDSEEAVVRASDEFFATRQRGDAPAFAGFFTQDGIYMVPGLVDASGRVAVEELARKRFAGGGTNDFKVDRREIQVTGDSAYELGWFSESTSSHRMKGRHFILWKRGTDATWRVQRYFYNFSDAVPL